MFFGLKKKLCFGGLQKIFSVQNKKRRKTTRDTTYSAMSGIPSGGPPGNTHTKELRHSLRGTDARLESVLNTDKCLCDACCARFSSTPNFVVLFSYFGLKIFFRPKQIFLRPKNTCRNTNNMNTNIFLNRTITSPSEKTRTHISRTTLRFKSKRVVVKHQQ